MSFGIPVRNGLAIGLLTSTTLSSSRGLSPAMSLDFLVPYLDSRITFSRGSNATLVDATGKITYAPNNLVRDSQNITTANWTIFGGATRAANAGTAPDGTGTANRLTSANATAFMGVYANTATLLNVNLVSSIYLKAGTQRYVQLIDDAGDGNDDFANFDLQAGIAQTTASGVSPTITAVGDGWYRCSINVRNLGLSQAAFYISFVSSLTATRVQAFAGTGNETLFLWGAQQEQVTYQTVPGTYNATTASAYYGPRFDYDPVTLAPKGLLIEEARTNLALQSQAFNATWQLLAVTVSANVTPSPDGTTNADLIIPDATNAVHWLQQNPACASSTAYTLSLYVKPNGYSKIGLQENNTTGAYATFNCTGSGSVLAQGLGGTGRITQAGSGWYRIDMTATTGAAQTAYRIDLYVLPDAYTTGQPSFAWTPNGTSGIFLYGAQLEAGSFATSYIPTVASTVTRSADVATMTGTNFSSWYNQSEGTFVINADSANLSTAFASTALTVFQNASNRYGFHARPAAGGFSWYTYVGAVEQARFDSAAIAANQVVSMAGAYKLNDTNASFNGSIGTTDTSCSLASAMTTLYLGVEVNLNYLNGHIRQIAYYNTRLPNAQLQTLTAPSLATTLSLSFTNQAYTVGV